MANGNKKKPNKNLFHYSTFTEWCDCVYRELAIRHWKARRALDLMQNKMICLITLIRLKLAHINQFFMEYSFHLNDRLDRTMKPFIAEVSKQWLNRLIILFSILFHIYIYLRPSASWSVSRLVPIIFFVRCIVVTVSDRFDWIIAHAFWHAQTNKPERCLMPSGN